MHIYIKKYMLPYKKMLSCVFCFKVKYSVRLPTISIGYRI